MSIWGLQFLKNLDDELFSFLEFCNKNADMTTMLTGKDLYWLKKNLNLSLQVIIPLPLVADFLIGNLGGCSGRVHGNVDFHVEML